MKAWLRSPFFISTVGQVKTKQEGYSYEISYTHPQIIFVQFRTIFWRSFGFRRRGLNLKEGELSSRSDSSHQFLKSQSTCRSNKNIDIRKEGEATAIKLLIYPFRQFVINLKQILWWYLGFWRRNLNFKWGEKLPLKVGLHSQESKPRYIKNIDITNAGKATAIKL